MNEYTVALDVYNGPLDLLLFLIRREEVDIHDIPIARITEQYVKYISLLQQLDPDSVSEFLVLAASLMEIKSRMLLPTPPPDEGDEDIADPRMELVRQLLEYKKFKDAARYLEDSADLQAQKFPRVPIVPPKPTDELELDNLDIWDLFDAFNRLLEQTGQRRDAVHKVGVDDTPIALHAEDIVDSIEHAGGSQKFEEIFLGRTKAEMIGLFLALLELIRNRRIRVSQDRPFATIWIHLLDATPLDIEADLVAAAHATGAFALRSDAGDEPTDAIDDEPDDEDESDEDEDDSDLDDDDDDIDADLDDDDDSDSDDDEVDSASSEVEAARGRSGDELKGRERPGMHDTSDRNDAGTRSRKVADHDAPHHDPDEGAAYLLVKPTPSAHGESFTETEGDDETQ